MRVAEVFTPISTGRQQPADRRWEDDQRRHHRGHWAWDWRNRRRYWCWDD
ncbi:MAG: hypothetical protein JO296_17160 [Pseudonocardiales bacterium]|jgi:hypothetical protein|nr:hypothetical protein [Pseudonocardiales bacterium]MBV9651845.1 hypothetical protein [Pseudonocardiales bacterium]